MMSDNLWCVYGILALITCTGYGNEERIDSNGR